MKKKNHFYVTLISNNSSESYENRQSSFTNYFSQSISLDGEWEVALAALSIYEFKSSYVKKYGVEENFFLHSSAFFYRINIKEK